MSLCVSQVHYVAYYRSIHQLTMQIHRSEMVKDCYVVFIGRVPGVYDHWLDAHAQVDRYPGASHRGFDSSAEAENSYLRWMLRQERE